MDRTKGKISFVKLRRVFRIVRKVFVWLVLLALLGSTGYLGWSQYASEKRLKDIQSQFTQRNITFSSKLPKADIPVSENATRFWKAACKLAEVDLDYGAITWPELGNRITPDAATALKQCVDTNAMTYALVQKAMEKPRCDFTCQLPVEWKEYFTFLSETRRLSRVQEARIFHAIAISDAQLAVDTCMEHLALLKALEVLPDGFGHMVRVSIAAMTVYDIEMLLSHMTLTTQQLEQLERGVADGLAIPLHKIAENDLRQCVASIKDPHLPQSIVRVGSFETEVIVRFNRPYPFNEWWDSNDDNAVHQMHWWHRMGMRLSEIADELTVYRNQQQFYDHAQFYIKVYDLTQGGTWTLDQYQKLIASLSLPEEMIAGYDMFSQINSKWLACQLALKVERSRLIQGHWPVNLGDVIFPIPVDAYDQPMRMILGTRYLRLYSIGADGKDDQGLGRWEDPAKYNFKDDSAFRLLPVEMRNRAVHKQENGM
jgi:hypothetical protein